MTFTIALLLAALSVQNPESKAIPKDSVEVEARGCLKGRVFTANAEPEDEGARRGPDVTGRRFRLAGNRELMGQVKKHDGQRVELVGIVRKDALSDQSRGIKLGGTRVIIGAQGGDPGQMNSRMAAPSVPVMDLIAIRAVSDRCVP